MFSYIIGIVTEKQEGMLVLENNGIGYELLVSNNTISAISYDNEPVKLYTYFQVKEDGVALYGFYTKEEKDLFMKIITVSGVGPKMAITMLSSISISEFVNAILNEDVKMLCTVKGLGKKTAERVVLELKDKIDVIGMPSKTPLENAVNEDALNDATEALISLGVGKNEAYRLAKMYAGPDTTVEEIISNALRGMSR